MLAEAPAGTEQLLSLAELLSWGQLPGHLLVLPPEDKEWAVCGSGICVAVAAFVAQVESRGSPVTQPQSNSHTS